MAATGIKKLKRSHLMHLLDSTFGGETPSWFLIGKNIEDPLMTHIHCIIVASGF